MQVELPRAVEDAQLRAEFDSGEIPARSTGIRRDSGGPRDRVCADRHLALELDQVAVLVDAEEEDEVVVVIAVEYRGKARPLVRFERLAADDQFSRERPVDGGGGGDFGKRGRGPHVDVPVAFVLVEEEQDALGRVSGDGREYGVHDLLRRSRAGCSIARCCRPGGWGSRGVGRERRIVAAGSRKEGRGFRIVRIGRCGGFGRRRWTGRWRGRRRRRRCGRRCC